MNAKLRALVVDDEALARRQVIHLLQAYRAEIAVAGEARNGCEALEMMVTDAPDVVFLDVEMPGMSGLDAVRQLREQPALVLTTAYQEHALQAFEENTIDYLLKPIGARDMERAIGKLRRWVGERSPTRPTGPAAKDPVSSEAVHLLVPTRDVIKPIAVRDIVYVEARDKYAEIHTDRDTYLFDQTLNELETRLPPQMFVRIHRRCIVNVRFIRELHKYGNRTLRLVLSVPTETDILVSRRCADELMNRLEYGA
jgi:two-component system LytT family response regulator